MPVFEWLQPLHSPRQAGDAEATLVPDLSRQTLPCDLFVICQFAYETLPSKILCKGTLLPPIELRFTTVQIDDDINSSLGFQVDDTRYT
mmetsp:Transcript_22741/g.35770  ORF Transcript_22741/g.35770 Transcript_22741/m.35770 type:complete len:89 (+) Transcript_22741:755-1021(+)